MAATSGHARVQSAYQISRVRARSADSRTLSTSPSKSAICPPMDPTPTALQKIKNEQNQVDGWLEAIRASSPRYTFSELEDENDQVYFEAVAKTRYKEWVVSAFLC